MKSIIIPINKTFQDLYLKIKIIYTATNIGSCCTTLKFLKKVGSTFDFTDWSNFHPHARRSLTKCNYAESICSSGFTQPHSQVHDNSYNAVI